MNKQSSKQGRTRYVKSSKNTSAVLKSEHYTNLMLITVVQAMVLLIGQLLIYNCFAIPTLTGNMWNSIVPSLFVISIVCAAVSLFFIVKKSKKILWSLCSFSVYLAILMSVIRYIPNSWSDVLNRPIVNAARGQKIGVVLSVLYIAGSFVYYSIAARKADKTM